MRVNSAAFPRLALVTLAFDLNDSRMGTGPLGFVGVCLCYAAVAVLFRTPGFFLASITLRFLPRLVPFRVVRAFAASCLLGYVAFWVYVVHSTAGLISRSLPRSRD